MIAARLVLGLYIKLIARVSGTESSHFASIAPPIGLCVAGAKNAATAPVFDSTFTADSIVRPSTGQDSRGTPTIGSDLGGWSGSEVGVGRAVGRADVGER